MSSIATSSKATLGHSPSSPYISQESHWSEDTISKPKPVLVSKRSLHSLGFHPPYAIGDPAYLRLSSDTPDYHLYQFKGAHIVSLLFEKMSPNSLWAIGTVVSTDASQSFEATTITQAVRLLPSLTTREIWELIKV